MTIARRRGLDIVPERRDRPRRGPPHGHRRLWGRQEGRPGPGRPPSPPTTTTTLPAAGTRSPACPRPTRSSCHRAGGHGQDRQQRRRPAPGRPRRGRRGLRGGHRGHHPLRRRVPVHRRRPHRPGAVGAPGRPAHRAPLGGPLVFSGGSPGIVPAWCAAPASTSSTENDTETLKRRSGRSAPHNLYTDSQTLYAAGRRRQGSRRPFASFLKPGETSAAAGATPVSSMDIAPGRHHRLLHLGRRRQGLEPLHQRPAPHARGGRGPDRPGNVIVQFTSYSRFAADAAVTYPEVIGSGEAWSSSTAPRSRARGRRRRPARSPPTPTPTAPPMVFPPGRTVVELVHSDASVTVEAPPAPAAPPRSPPDRLGGGIPIGSPDGTRRMGAVTDEQTNRPAPPEATWSSGAWPRCSRAA